MSTASIFRRFLSPRSTSSAATTQIPIDRHVIEVSAHWPPESPQRDVAASEAAEPIDAAVSAVSVQASDRAATIAGDLGAKKTFECIVSAEPLTIYQLADYINKPLDDVRANVAKLVHAGLVSKWTDQTASYGQGREYVGTRNRRGISEPTENYTPVTVPRFDSRTVLSIIRRAGIITIRRLAMPLRGWQWRECREANLEYLHDLVVKLVRQGHVTLIQRKRTCWIKANDPSPEWPRCVLDAKATD